MTAGQTRITRYQAAILDSDRLLLIQVRDHRLGKTFWLIPGGGREQGESEEACVRREVREETHLEVRVERLLFEAPNSPEDIYEYRWTKTYLCRPISGEARPGEEPEMVAQNLAQILAVKWIPLWEEAEWGRDITNDPITYTNLQRIRGELETLRRQYP